MIILSQDGETLIDTKTVWYYRDEEKDDEYKICCSCDCGTGGISTIGQYASKERCLVLIEEIADMQIHYPTTININGYNKKTYKMPKE